MIQLKVQSIGDQVGIVLPIEVIERLNIHPGDTLMLKHTSTGFEFVSSSIDEEALRVAEEGISKYENVLRELAK